jgi:lipopolysaccharide transport system ATP-binding protein
MSDTVIQVQNLSKKYTLGHQQQGHGRYKALRDVIADKAKSLLVSPRIKSQRSHVQDEFWALKDVSFEIRQGDRVGIIGRNGAGKSTLLKILSRITEPTQGRINIKGRVASLLEVGTGFHPELTGRENIYLNGAILGMSKVEIQQKFDEIVAFAEVEKFLDTPVKRYSSGMYVRLAFAVAANLEPEILIVDEVLAVGDAHFQQKCLGKMQDVAHSGRTVIFVSHNMAAIRQLCNSGILMQKGSVNFVGTADEAVDRYLKINQSNTTFSTQATNNGIKLVDINFFDKQTQNICQAAIFNRDYNLNLLFHASEPITNAAIVVQVYDEIGTLVSSICTPEEDMAPFLLKDHVKVSFELPRLQLMPGQYSLNIFVYRSNDPKVYLEVQDALFFDVHPAIVGDAMWAYRSDHGIVRISAGCKVEKVDSLVSNPNQ